MKRLTLALMVGLYAVSLAGITLGATGCGGCDMGGMGQEKDKAK